MLHKYVLINLSAACDAVDHSLPLEAPFFGVCTLASLHLPITLPSPDLNAIVKHFSLFYLHPLSSLSTLSPLTILLSPAALISFFWAEVEFHEDRDFVLSLLHLQSLAQSRHPKNIDGSIYCMIVYMKFKNRRNESVVIDVRTVVTCGEIMTGKEHKGTW